MHYKASRNTYGFIIALLLTAIALESRPALSEDEIPGWNHTVWATPGSLVEVRLPALPTGPTNGDDPEPVLLTGGVPDSAEILENLDETHTFFWVPVVADIGEVTISMRQLDGFDASVISEHRLQVTVLEAESESPRLNALPKLTIKTSAAYRSNAIQLLTAGKPFELVANAVDSGADEPIVNVQGMPGDAHVERLAPSSQRVRWVPDKSLHGYEHVTVYAVDAAEPFQYSSADINMLVEKETVDYTLVGRWLEHNYSDTGNVIVPDPQVLEISTLGNLP